MPRGKRCRNFQWRDKDAAYLAERKSDRVVFRKIRREQLKNHKTARIIRGLFLSPLWAPRMTGKSAESWRVNYYRWLREKCSAVQAKKCPSEACKHGAKRTREKFFREKAR